MAGRYLLALEEQCGTNTFTTLHLVTAEDRQKVKYHYHRTLKRWGYHDSQFGKHILRRDEIMADIGEIRQLSEAEYDFLDKFIARWTQF